VAKAAAKAAKETARDIVREELKRLPRELRAPAGRVANSLVKGASKIFGHGDYTIHSNSLIKGGHVAPVFTNSSHGVRIVDREFVGTVQSGVLSGGSTVFTNTAYRINPANAQLFPWLSQIATLFDQWEPHGIVLEFVSTSSEYNGTSQALGVVIAATDYDVNDPDYASRGEMENSAYAISAKASSNILHGIECSRDERPTKLLYTESNNTNQRSNLSDLGKFQLATQGMSASGVTLGELYVTYDIEFYKKQIRPQASDYATFTTGYIAKAPTDAWSKGATLTGASGTFATSATVDAGGRIDFVANQEYIGRRVRMQLHCYKDATGGTLGTAWPAVELANSYGISSATNVDGVVITFGNNGDCPVYQEFTVTSAAWGIKLLPIGVNITASLDMTFEFVETA